MTSATFMFFLAVLLGGGVLGTFLTLLVGIHVEERRMSLKTTHRTRTTTSTRRLLGVTVRVQETEETIRPHSLTR